MNANKKVNIILINALPRHDLMPTSCVNNEVVKFNRQLKKIVKLHENVEFLEIELPRKHFIRHGQHLNNDGKELISVELAKLVKQCLKRKVTFPIQMNWKDDNLVVQSKTVKNSEPVTFMDSPRLTKGDTEKIRNGKDLSQAMDHEVQAEEVGRTFEDRRQVDRSSSRHNKAIISRSKDFLW
jgi:hypothetical protein